MILILDTNNSQFALIQSEKDEPKWTKVENEEYLVKEVEKHLGGREIQGIIVIQGEGSFSHTREGVVFANMLALAKGTKILAVSAEDFADLSECFKKLEESKPLEPGYSSEPNIG